jgi:5-(carboxyamino)imidazole ribonucleotide synthase
MLLIACSKSAKLDTLELFAVDDHLIVNEFAPRVHNSGHWTIEGSETSQ